VKGTQTRADLFEPGDVQALPKEHRYNFVILVGCRLGASRGDEGVGDSDARNDYFSEFQKALRAETMLVTTKFVNQKCAQDFLAELLRQLRGQNNKAISVKEAIMNTRQFLSFKPPFNSEVRGDKCIGDDSWRGFGINRTADLSAGWDQAKPDEWQAYVFSSR